MKTTMRSNELGNVTSGCNTSGGCGYLTNEKTAPNTNRQYSYHEYIGGGIASHKKIEINYKLIGVLNEK